MIIWLNGAFGAGKTVAAHELSRRLMSTRRTSGLAQVPVCDPEEIGFGLHRFVPREMGGDFQDEPAWRLGVRQGLARIEATEQYPAIVVPMTLVRPAYVEEIIGGLRRAAIDVRHVVLGARPETLRRRLSRRGAALPLAGDPWALSRVDSCVAALAAMPAVDPDVLRIETDDLDHDGVVEAIGQLLDLELGDRSPRALRPVRRATTQLRAIRRGL